MSATAEAAEQRSLASCRRLPRVLQAAKCQSTSLCISSCDGEYGSSCVPARICAFDANMEMIRWQDLVTTAAPQECAR
jgi:hypothetical protein